MKYTFTNENGRAFYLSPLKADEIDRARLLCDECVGENLYTKEEIASSMNERDSFFYLLKSETGENAGYIYFYLTDEKSIADYAKLDVNLFYSVYRQQHNKVGKIQSVGIKEQYRGDNLATQMIKFVLEKFKSISIEAVYIVCWKPGGIMPLKKALLHSDFCFLTEAKKVWYDDIDLICPYCNGRCHCDAEVYYKLLNRGDEE